MEFYYQSYGLVLKSFFEIPELKTVSSIAQVDVTIRQGTVPEGLPNPTLIRPRFEASKGLFLGRLSGVGRFLLNEEGELTVQFSQHPDWQCFKNYLFGTILSIALYTKGGLPLHASCIEIDGEAVAFCGDSGAGKSTTASIFENNGYRFFTDDLLALNSTQKGFPICYAGPRIHRLNKHSIAKLGRSIEGKKPFEDKYLLTELNWTTELSMPIRAIFIISNQNPKPQEAIVALKGINKLQAISGNLYKRHWIDAIGVRDTIAIKVTTLIQGVATYKLNREFLHKERDRSIISTITSAIA